MNNPLANLRTQMQVHNVDAYLIPTADFHGSESVGTHFTCRAYVSGFTGSDGTLLILKEWAGLWTDGRYFLQAEEQLQGSGITLMKQSEPGVPSIEEFLKKRLSSGQTLGFDGRCLSTQFGQALKQKLSGITLKSNLDLAGEVWTERPPLSAEPAWLLDVSYAGESREKKVKQVRTAMQKEGADTLLLSTLDDIAWLLNLRGHDISYSPVVLSFLSLTQTDALLFANPAVFSDEIQETLAQSGVTLRPYEDIYTYAETLPDSQCVWLDECNLNLTLFERLPSTVRVLNRPVPTERYKAIKNKTEVENEKLAHLKDGIAITRFIYWLKHNVGSILITERSAADWLEEQRREQTNYVEASFAPILAYGAHGAIVHYSATPETDLPLFPEGFLLADTGGHYLEGTTDCTRTIALGALTAEQKQHYTAVLCGLLQLADAQFLQGCSGLNLDYLARQPLWSMQLDYKHGTGHGVGYLLNVHEGPQSIRWRGTTGALLEPGMITSDEPGLYLAGQYGIRLENLLVCEQRVQNSYGTFLGFSHLTLVPFDLEAVEATQMTPEQRTLLNRYHETVFEKIAPHLAEKEAAWLQQATRPI